MTLPPLLLALDAGSQSVRALLFDPQGRVVSRGQCPVPPPLPSSSPGVVEFDALTVWDALVSACRTCLTNAPLGSPAAIVSLALTTQRACVIASDAEGRPLRPAIHWLDKRTAPPQLSGFLGGVVGLLGEKSRPGRVLSLSRHNVLKRDHPEVHRQARWLLSLAGWLTLKLTGEAADAPGSITGLSPLNHHSGDWSSSNLLPEVCGTPREKLPALRPPGSELGRLTAATAAELGLVQGLPLISVGGDKQAELLGSGVTSGERGVAAVSLGTGSSLMLPSPTFRQSLRLRWITNAAAEPGVFSLEYMVFRGFWTLSWLLRELGSEERRTAMAEGISPEEALARTWTGISAGSDGLLCLPRWSEGVEHPGERGAFLGFTEVHTRGHLVRALVEGIAFDLRRGKLMLEKDTGLPIQSLRVCGGGSRSEEAVQILADVIGVPVSFADQPEISARGAAMGAAVGARIHSNHHEAARAMARMGRTLQPIPERASLYGRVFEEAWLPALEANRRPSRALSNLFG